MPSPTISYDQFAEQSGPGYDPQVVVLRWLPLATIAILTPGGSILTRDVVLIYIEKTNGQS